jgi:thymidylate kinase
MTSQRANKAHGLWIAFFGPDGVGKSTVIEQVKDQLGAAFSGVLQFHFRPMLGRHLRNQKPVTDPHNQVLRSPLISLAKLIYWLLDCWCGYLVAISPVRRTSGLVIFDRYYPDILADPLRYRLPKSSLRFAAWLVALAPHPDLSILLHAPAEVVQSRKQEVPLGESRRQQSAYLTIFQTMSNKLLVDAELPVNEIAQQVSVAVLTLLEDASWKQREALLFADL